MKKLQLLFLFFLTISGFAQDEITPLGTYEPNFFAELLDVEILDINTAYILGVGGFIFMDISTPNQPSIIGRFDPGNIYIRFYNGIVKGNIAIGAARFDGLYILNISSLAQPTLSRQYSSTNFSYESVDIYNQYAYAAAHQDGVEILNIQNPSAPYQINLLTNLQNVWDVFIDSTYLYVADGRDGLKIFSLSDPANPQLVSTVPTSGLARGVIIENNLACVALGAAGIDIIDISDPSNPQHLSNFFTRFGIVNHIAISNNYIFAATWELVMAIDISDPQNPLLVATEDTPVRAMGIAAQNNQIYVADWSRFKSYSFLDRLVSDIHIKPNVYDFGYQGPQVPISKKFEVYNLGEADLQIYDISATHPQFSVSPSSLQISAGDSAITTVSFNPIDSSTII
jgi:hypothetical protein